MFERVLLELNIDIPTQSEATILLSRIIAQEIVDGKKSPYSGAREIWALSNIYENVKTPFVFNGLASVIEDFHDYQNRRYYGEEHCQHVIRDIEQQIIDEACKLLSE